MDFHVQFRGLEIESFKVSYNNKLKEEYGQLTILRSPFNKEDKSRKQSSHHFSL